MKNIKPLGQKAYGSIPHLPNSRMGDGDHHIEEGQAIIATIKARDKKDLIIVQEKLDGSNCAVAKVGGKILALGRSGYLADTSPWEQHKLFSKWVESECARFDELLNEGERVCGEWLAQAHGTIYKLLHEPFVPFDIMLGNERTIFRQFLLRILPQGKLFLLVTSSTADRRSARPFTWSGIWPNQGMHYQSWVIMNSMPFPFIHAVYVTYSTEFLTFAR